jgi:formamidopyrimidine-DNA glycosylase
LSVEVAEACILGKQMNSELAGKEVTAVLLKNCPKLQKLGFINIYCSDFDRLLGGKVEFVASRGNVVRVKLDNGLNILLAPEYGGRILYYTKESAVPAKFHLKLGFKDGSALTVTLTGMGIIQALKDDELDGSYVFRRDFSKTASPTDVTFSFEQFSKQLADKKVNIKTVLVGKDAVVVGLGNSAFQDVIYRAGIHPKRKSQELKEDEKQSLYGAIKHVISERIRLGGKSQFVDFYGKQGTYEPAMGPNMKGKVCWACGVDIEKLTLGGGQVYFCSNCQK